MIRILSALAIVPFVVAAIWFLPPAWLVVVAELVLGLAFVEYARLARAMGARVSYLLAGGAAAATCLAVFWSPAATDVVLMAAVLAFGAVSVAAARAGRDVLVNLVAGLFASLYLGLPFGAMAATRSLFGREALLLLILTVAASDTAQFYAGSLLGRHRLAPAISPKKSVEGAVGGLVAGPLTLAVAGQWWLAAVPVGWRLALGAIVVAAGIIGDLFESQAKRSAGVKDSSSVIPGHGGVLDRVDALLFAAPAYYLFLRFGAW
jgi:phosphatidate cytidylyltransferase